MQLAKESTDNINVTREKVTVIIVSCFESFTMASSKLNYDIIIEKRLCENHKETIDYVSNIVKTLHRHKLFTIRELASSDSKISVCALE